MGGNISFPGINTNNNRFAEPVACLFNQPGVFYGGGAQDNTLYASLKQLLYCLELANATTQLGGN